jgi:GDPmannose 4,6-dehydratase
MDVKFYPASSSEMFGRMVENPAGENTPFYPRSPYGVSKLYGHWITTNYRESYDMFNCCGILFNHESERRGIEFVTRKISDGVAKIKLGLAEDITLGNLKSKRDWGYAPDYVEAMWLMLQRDKPDDYVVATGKTHSVRDFVELCFKEIGKDITWVGEAEEEIGIVEDKVVIRVSPLFYRPCEVDAVIGDASKIRNIGWVQNNTIHDLISDMMSS